MTIVILAFFVTMLIMFVGLMLALKPTSEQKALQHRIVRIQTGGGESGNQTDHLGNYLTPVESTAFGWLEDLIQHSSISEFLKSLLLRADSSSSVGTVIVWCAGLAVASGTACYFLVPIPLIAPGAATIAAYMPVVVLKFRAARRLAAFEKGLPGAIEMMSRSLRAGHSLAAAIGIVAEQSRNPVKEEFTEIFKKQNFGLPLREALMQLLERIPSQDLRVVVTAILVQKDTGGNLVDILDRTVSVVNERLRIQGEIKTHTAQGRMTGWILCALPLVMLALINIVNPGYSSVLLNDQFGRELLGAGVGLLAIGAFVIRAIVNGIEV